MAPPAKQTAPRPVSAKTGRGAVFLSRHVLCVCAVANLKKCQNVYLLASLFVAKIIACNLTFFNTLHWISLKI